MKRKLKFISLLMLSLVLLASTTANATLVILDQSQTSWDAGIWIAAPPNRSLSQTFTAGMSGDLVRVSILLTDTRDQQYPARISILGTTGETHAPDEGNVLWYKDFDVLEQGWFDVDVLVSAPFLTAGVVYGIKVETADTVSGNPDDMWRVMRTENLYSNGQLWENRGDGWVPLTISGTSYPDADAAFKTYMIPEPATIAILGLGGLFLIPRRRK